MTIASARSIALAAAVAATFIGVAVADKPNIVLIMVDDLGYHELGITGQLDRAAAGERAIETPNLDRLGQQGMTLSNFYATPICSSTRGALMTGFHNGHSSIDRNGGSNGGNALRAVDVTMPQVLKDAGYTTGAFGKWGINGYDHKITGGGAGNLATAAVTHPDATPVAKSFDEFYGYLNHVHAHNYYVDFLWEHDRDGSGDPGGVQLSPTSRSDYSHDLIADRSLQFIADHADPAGRNPFFLYLPYTIPHSKFDPPNDAILQDFLGRGYTTREANYAAMIKRMDASVGDVVERLQDPNGDGDTGDSVYDETLIVFLSDNGGTNENSLFNGGGDLRGQKGSVHEGGTKSPFIAHWNGVIAPGQTNDATIAGLEDLLATFADVAEADAPVGLDSKSIAPVLTGDQVRGGRHFLIHEARVNNDWSIRMGEWKLSKAGSNQLRLFNLDSDPSESTDLLANPSSAQQDIANRLLEIALAEGVESDAGSGPTQTTHIVQYKQWAPIAGSTEWTSPANWAGGTELNTRGTPANNFATAPASNWIPTVTNAPGSDAAIRVSSDSEVLAFEATGSGGSTRIEVPAGVTLTARNGARIDAGAVLELSGGAIATFRELEIRAGGTLEGNGIVENLHSLPGEVINDGVVSINPSPGQIANVSVVKNGGFEEGTQADGDADWTFEEIADWITSDNAALDAAKPNNAFSGGYRGLVAARSDSLHDAAQNTGHILSADDAFTLSFNHRGFSGWDDGVDQVVAEVYYLDDSQQPQPLGGGSVSSETGVWQTASITLPPVTDAAAFGREVWVRFNAVSGNEISGAEFASLDDVALTLERETAASPAVLQIDGDYQQTSDGRLVVDLYGNGGVAGADFDRLEVSGVAALGGTLEVRFAAGFAPSPGDVFSILEAGAVDGVFDQLDTVELAGGLALTAQYSPTRVSLVVGGVLGDYNHDGTVDAADFTVWRDTLGSTELLSADGNRDGRVDLGDYLLWRSQLGETASPLHASTGVPEPSGGLIAVACLGSLQTARGGRSAAGGQR
ncbi:MAG: sulfatase-like hydrolase/transferase [Planctomycetota bacterium]